MMSDPLKPLPIPAPSNADKAHRHIPSFDELAQDMAKAEALFQSHYNQATMLSGEAHNLWLRTSSRSWAAGSQSFLVLPSKKI
jgi:hypothetical protein